MKKERANCCPFHCSLFFEFWLVCFCGSVDLGWLALLFAKCGGDGATQATYGFNEHK